MPEPATGAAPDALAREVTAFWREAGPKRWFAKDSAFDDRFRVRFLETHFRAARRELDHWTAEAEGSLALLLLLDQFPRNCFRGSAHMYATDPLARHYARRAVAAGHDREVEAELRPFFYLPFEHSEDPSDQERSLELHLAMGEEAAKYARHHRDIILRFGRFPHRNAMLGRGTTAGEQAWLDAGGFTG